MSPENSISRQKNIVKLDQIKEHLEALYFLQIPVGFNIDNKVELPESYLVYNDEINTGLVVKTRSVIILDASDVEFTYSYMGHIWRFSSRIVGREKNLRNNSFIRIELPEVIACLERRAFLRICPPNEDTVTVECFLKGEGKVVFPVINLSGGGLAFIMPDAMDSIAEESALSFTLCLPEQRKLELDALVAGISLYLNTKRVGVEFINISESDRATLFRYVFQKQRDEFNAPDKFKKLNEAPARVFILGSVEPEKYKFLKQDFAIKIFNPPEDLDLSAPLNADIVILEGDGGPSARILDSLKTAQASSFFPILVIGTDPMGLDGTTETIRYYPPPFKESFIIRILNNLIYQRKLTRKIDGLNRTLHHRMNRNLIVIDSFKNIEKSRLDYLRDIRINVVMLEGEEDLLIRIIQGKPDLILLHERMAKADLFSLCKLMSINKKLMGVPKLVVTEDMKNVQSLLKEKIISDALPRSFSNDDLANKIDFLLASETPTS